MSDWKEVNKTNPCECCGRTGWCSYSNAEGSRTHYCMRPSKPEFRIPDGYKVIKETGDGGVIVALAKDDRDDSWKPRKKPLIAKSKNLRLDDWTGMQAMLWSSAKQSDIDELARNLGIDSFGLVLLGIGYHKKQDAFSFPMFDEDFNIIGMRLRTNQGQKFAIKGSRSGIFGIPGEMFTRVGKPVLIAEGPTDTAALIGLGYPESLGRPSCSGGTDILMKMLPGHDVVIVSDGDDAGRAGAKSLAAKLSKVASRVRIIRPPAKDIRQWVQDGGTKSAVDFLIDNAKECTNGGKIQSSST